MKETTRIIKEGSEWVLATANNEEVAFLPTLDQAIRFLEARKGGEISLTFLSEDDKDFDKIKKQIEEEPDEAEYIIGEFGATFLVMLKGKNIDWE